MANKRYIKIFEKDKIIHFKELNEEMYDLIHDIFATTETCRIETAYIKISKKKITYEQVLTDLDSFKKFCKDIPILDYIGKKDLNHYTGMAEVLFVLIWDKPTTAVIDYTPNEIFTLNDEFFPIVNLNDPITIIIDDNDEIN